MRKKGTEPMAGFRAEKKLMGEIEAFARSLGWSKSKAIRVLIKWGLERK